MGSRADLVESYLRDGANLRIASMGLRDDIQRAAHLIVETFGSDGKLLAFGNGGSAADAQHIAAEFTGRFRENRRPLAALALTANSSAVTSIGNDFGFETIFARQILAHARPGDVALGISTSGRSPNVIEGLTAARKAGAKTIGMSGASDEMAFVSDVLMRVPSTTTSLVQEVHIAIGHLLCLLVEDELFG